MNEFFVYLEDIIVSPGYLRGWRIFKLTAVALGPKNLSRTFFLMFRLSVLLLNSMSDSQSMYM